MKLNEVCTSMEKRYLAEQEEEKAKKARVEVIKEILTKLIDTFQKQIENDLYLYESIYDDYKRFRKAYPKANKICTVLEFSISGKSGLFKIEFGFNGRYTEILNQLNCDTVVKQYTDFVEKYYEVVDKDEDGYEGSIYVLLHLKLNKGTVILRHGGTKKYKEFMQDLKQAFPDALVRRSAYPLYSNENDFLKTIDIVKAIKSANPALRPGIPTIVSGRLDGWIGIGYDDEDDEFSYNSLRAKCIDDALNKYFKEKTPEEIREIISSDSVVLQEVRAQIENEAQNLGIDKERFYFPKKAVKRIKTIEKKYKNEPLRSDSSSLLIDGLRGNIFQTYLELRKKYGKDSE